MPNHKIMQLYMNILHKEKSSTLGKMFQNVINFLMRLNTIQS